MKSIPQNWQDHDNSIKPYINQKRVVGLFSRIFSLTLLVILVGTGVWLKLNEQIVIFVPRNGLLHTLIYCGVLGVLFEGVAFPFQWFHYLIERKFKLSNQEPLSWLVDLVKGLCVGTLIGAIALSLLYWCYTEAGARWWFLAWMAFVVLTVLLAQLAPVLLIPLFFKLSPLEPSPLKERLLGLCKKYGIEIKDIFHLGLGEKTEKGNAAFVGLGKTKKIIIGDTFYQRYSHDEVEAVFAHELGHQIHDDLWKGIGLSSLFTFIVFSLSNQALSIIAPKFSGTFWGTGPALTTFGVLVGIIQIPFGVVETFFSRWREQLADQFASETIQVANPLANSLEKLTIQNKGQFKPHWLIEFLTHSHPAPWRRIQRLRNS